MFKNEDYAKGSFYSESVIRFSNLQKKIFQVTILSLKFEFFVYCYGEKFKFQVQDSDLEYFFWRFGDLKNTSHFLKKATLRTKTSCGLKRLTISSKTSLITFLYKTKCISIFSASQKNRHLVLTIFFLPKSAVLTDITARAGKDPSS